LERIVMRVFVLVFVVIAAGIVATYARYGSLHPCDWLHKDMLAASDLPGPPEVVEPLVEGWITTRFLLDGITEPTALDCLEGWWSFRIDEIENIETTE
jgi:hypothetical protein